VLQVSLQQIKDVTHPSRHYIIVELQCCAAQADLQQKISQTLEISMWWCISAATIFRRNNIVPPQQNPTAPICLMPFAFKSSTTAFKACAASDWKTMHRRSDPKLIIIFTLNLFTQSIQCMYSFLVMWWALVSLGLQSAKWSCTSFD
jgi:hypothetical protein